MRLPPPGPALYPAPAPRGGGPAHPALPVTTSGPGPGPELYPGYGLKTEAGPRKHVSAASEPLHHAASFGAFNNFTSSADVDSLLRSSHDFKSNPTHHQVHQTICRCSSGPLPSECSITDEELVTYNVKELNRVLKTKGATQHKTQTIFKTCLLPSPYFRIQ